MSFVALKELCQDWENIPDGVVGVLFFFSFFSPAWAWTLQVSQKKKASVTILASIFVMKHFLFLFWANTKQQYHSQDPWHQYRYRYRLFLLSIAASVLSLLFCSTKNVYVIRTFSNIRLIYIDPFFSFLVLMPTAFRIDQLVETPTSI